MNDTEKLAMLVGYIKGVIGDAEYIQTINPRSVRKFLDELSKK